MRSGEYFFNSTAHKAQPRFWLDPNGTWIALNDNSTLRSGAAYWIFSKGDPTFTAPLDADFDATGRLDYGPAVETKQLTIRNLGVNSLAVSLANPEAFPLVIAGLNVNGDTTWTPLTTLVKTIASGASTTLNLGVRRSALPAGGETVLALSAQGILRRLPVSVQNPAAGAPNPLSGLWIGSVTLAAVSEPHSASPATPTATPAEFSMRLLLHVNDAGQTRLLKEVILMKQPNQPGPPPVAGALVLLSNPALIPQFTAPANHDGAPFATRVSSIGYDFDGRR